MFCFLTVSLLVGVIWDLTGVSSCGFFLPNASFVG